MKKFLITNLIIVLLISATACNKVEFLDYPWELTTESSYISNNEHDIKLTCSEDILTSSEGVFYFENHTNKTAYLGDPFILELKVSDTWFIVPINDGFATNDNLHIAESGHNYKYNANFTALYGDLPPGTYRLVADYSYESVKSAEKFFVCCEFTIN